jgi:hypothetical protein
MTIIDGTEMVGTIDRVRLGLFADALIRGGAGFPAASAVDVPGAWIDRVLAVRPDLEAVLVDVIAMEGDPEQILAKLQLEQRVTFDSFAFAIAGAYLINPRIRKLLGYPAAIPESNPAYPDEAESYLEDGILDVVIDRGPIYRPTPPAPELVNRLQRG